MHMQNRSSVKRAAQTRVLMLLIHVATKSMTLKARLSRLKQPIAKSVLSTRTGKKTYGTEPKKESLDEPVTPPSPPSGPSVVPGEGALSQDGGGGGILQQQQADEGTQQPPTIGEAEPLPPDIPPKQPEGT